MGDLPILYPISPLWRRRNDQRIAELRPELRGTAHAHVERCWLEGLAVVLMPPVRDDAAQLVLYGQGRKYLRGVWHVVDAGLVVTNALTSNDTPHGTRIRAAYDLAFLLDGVLVSPKRGADNDSWDGDYARVAEIGEGVGLEAGERWRTKAFPKGDRPHFQMKNWRALPRLG